MLSHELISKTGHENLQSVPRRSFSTVNGFISCPIVSRDISVGGFRKAIDVAVNESVGTNLLGMNFFDGFEFILDFQDSVIYVWEE